MSQAQKKGSNSLFPRTILFGRRLLHYLSPLHLRPLHLRPLHLRPLNFAPAKFCARYGNLLHIGH